MILKPFEMIKALFASKTVEAVKEVKKVIVSVTPAVTKLAAPAPGATASDAAAKKYAMEKLKEIDLGTCPSVRLSYKIARESD